MNFASSNSTVPPVTPLLVQLYDTHRLYKLAGDKAPEARRELCEIVADLLASSHKASEKELIADILISMVKQAEDDLKSAIAERLAVIEEAPLRLVLRLTDEKIEIAAPLLRFSKSLNDMDLLYIIQTHDAPYWQAIASRDNLPAQVSDRLADTRESLTARILASNQSIVLSAHSQSVLAEMAIADERIAKPLLQRHELPQEIVRRLYEYVSDDLKSAITTRYGEMSVAVRETIDDVIAEFSATPETGFKPSAAMLQAAEAFAQKGLLTPQLMLKTLKRGQIASFVAQCSKFAGLPVSVMLSIIRQPQGQGLVLIAKANDISRDDFISMFVLCKRLAQADRGFDHRDLNQAITYYDRIRKEVAIRLLRGCQQQA